MKEHYKSVLRGFSATLVEDVKMAGLLNHLVSYDVLSNQDSITIKSKGNRYEQVEDLLQALYDSDDTAFEKFCQALTANHQKHLAKELRELEKTSQEAPSAKTDSTEEEKTGVTPVKVKKKMASPSSEKEEETISGERDSVDGGTFALQSSQMAEASDTKPSKNAVYEWKTDRKTRFVLFTQFTEHLGTLVDEARLIHLFENKLKIDCQKYRNCTNKILHLRLQNEALEIEQSEEKYNLLVVAILSHGNKEGISTCKNSKTPDDKYITVDEICNYFKSSEVPQLNDCPKVFIVDACRGGEIQKATVRDPAQLGKDVDSIKLSTPNDADILISYSTTDGHPSFEVTKNLKQDGSPFIKYLVETLESSYEHEHLADIITQVHSKMADESIGGDLYTKQMPCMVSTFRKQLRFPKTK